MAVILLLLILAVTYILLRSRPRTVAVGGRKFRVVQDDRSRLPLRVERLGLSGKPDLVLLDPKSKVYLVCEYKSGYERLSHFLQTMCYAFLVQVITGRPSLGSVAVS